MPLGSKKRVFPRIWWVGGRGWWLHFALLHFSGDVNWLPVSFAVLYFLLLCSLVACCRVLMLPGFLYCIFAALQFCCVAFWLLC